MEYRRVAVELASPARRVVEFFGVLARQKGVRLTTDVPAGLAAQADPDRLEQVLANLVSNALKYTGEGGSVVVEARPSARGATLEVRDSGAGMTEEQQAKLFQRFVSGPGPEDSALPSAGLGLFVVKESVVGMGGTISVESKPAQGSRFIVELALA